MGVRECNRAYCESTLCDDFSDEYGFLCSYCLVELCEIGITDIRRFMITPAGGANDGNWSDYVRREFYAR